MRKLAWICLLVLAVTGFGWLLFAGVVHAGGWATFTLDHVPDAPHAGESIDLSFIARTHGRTPFDFAPGEASFLFEHRATGEILTATASPSGRATGHHMASIVLPTAGSWNWELRPGMYPSIEFQTLTVLPAVSTATPELSSVPANIVMAGSLLVALISNLWLGGAILPLPAQAATDQTASVEARGAALFVGKGCITCHYHGALHSSTMVGIGPDLSNHRGSAEFLHMWLANPSAVKPSTQMPNLGLGADEIDDLAAYLAQDR